MIAIKNAEIPKNCAQCWYSKSVYCIYHDSDWVGDHQANQTKPEWCPIIEIVQCKDCIFGEKVGDNRVMCELIDMKVDSNGYCECGSLRCTNEHSENM